MIFSLFDKLTLINRYGRNLLQSIQDEKYLLRLPIIGYYVNLCDNLKEICDKSNLKMRYFNC